MRIEGEKASPELDPLPTARSGQTDVRWVLALALFAAAASFVFLIVNGTLESRAYIRAHRSMRPLGPFPTVGVAVFSGLVLIEALALWRFLTGSWSTSLKRALVAFAATFGATAIFGVAVHMHAPPYVTFHVLWLLCLSVIALAAVLMALARSISRVERN
jgi:hypothetical protein